MTDTLTAGDNTYVSSPGVGPSMGGTAVAGAAPGAAGPAGQMGITSAVLWTIGGSAAALLALGYVFRRGQSLPPLRVDAINSLNVYFSWLVIHGTVKVIAYRYHGHKLAQAYLLIG
jgi:hypothetical protein